MAKRCEHCRFWRDTVVKGETASGQGVWWGDCANPEASGYRDGARHSLMTACEAFEAKTEEEKRNE